ncbi:hypothetical protein ACJJTC_010222 [Scirpophaga incertulas]
MDLLDWLLHFGLILVAVVAYLILFKRTSKKSKHYSEPGWNWPLKYLFARYYAVKRWKSQFKTQQAVSDLPRHGQSEGSDGISLRLASTDGTALLLNIRKLCGCQPLSEIFVYVRLADGTTFKLPRHPDTVIGAWTNITDGWSAGGLKFQVLEPEKSLRILYNGLLVRNDDIIQHVKINLIWTTASQVVRHPQEWSDQLAAEALSLEPWRYGDWSKLLNKFEEGSWCQWGAAQGRVQAFAAAGASAISEYVRVRGLRERSWVPRATTMRRSVALTAVAADGTALHLRAASYTDTFTQCVSGTVRLPRTNVLSIIGTNFNLPDYFESPHEIPHTFTIKIKVKGREMRVVVRCNDDGVQSLSGSPYQLRTTHRTAVVDIDGEPGTAVLDLGYVPEVIKKPEVNLSPLPLLSWLSEEEAGPVGFCLPFEHRAAACSAYVGGKGASLALLATVQSAEGYHVPPGFCLTIKALEEHLRVNTTLMDAVKQIEAANENYNEEDFKQKCAKAVDLFSRVKISGQIKENILLQLNDLRMKIAQENFGYGGRFAVRSSAVGEDSEVLSAAGQNETILGCGSDDDVLLGIQKCWGSMFAFTSAYYRRQNGQPCICGGGVVVQVMVAPRAAGVMFTRHPDNGDPSRILITANYGLGESVVSGSVEPDTFVVVRHLDDRLEISSTELGSKAGKIAACDVGVGMEAVSESERAVACLSPADVLRLAQLGVAQERLWGAGRDIEWAFCKDEIFLVQARPITSLERWSEEELLHELDYPIMADNELTTFANSGEVFPKPVTPLSYDIVLQPVGKGVDKAVRKDTDYEDSLVLSHNRCIFALYNAFYRKTSPKVETNIRLVEMAVHGHKVATKEILQIAASRRPVSWLAQFEKMYFLIKCILTSKWCMNDTIKIVNGMKVTADQDRPMELLKSIDHKRDDLRRMGMNHTFTSGANTGAQFIAMSVLMERRSDFSAEHCKDICTMLSSGNVLSAEVPQELAKLSRAIHDSGMFESFRQVDSSQAMHWLKEHLPNVYSRVCAFLDQHGHRAIMEIDMYIKPWALLNDDLMKILQNLKPSTQESTVSKSDTEIISALTTPKKPKTRKILSWLLPLCRRTVRHREATKSHMILGVHKLRLATIELGKYLVKKWYLPHYELVNFFRLLELQKYIDTRDPALLRKAIQRHQYYPRWCKLKFAELNTGWVQPLEARSSEAVRALGVQLVGTPVCSGDVVGRACVVNDFAEINQLQLGDILITNATDVGWSPYFPLLSGIVTELGGLISHGAVVAREYGLPCIVGATHATEVFQTGDIIRLSSTDGVVEKVAVTETQAPPMNNYVHQI